MGEVVYRCKTKATDREGDRIRPSLNWLFARRCELRLTTQAIECGDWTIRYAEIDDAVLLAIPTRLGTAHTLRVKSGDKTYQFQLRSTSLWRLVIDPYWLGDTPLPLRREVTSAGWREYKAQARKLLFIAVLIDGLLLHFILQQPVPLMSARFLNLGIVLSIPFFH